MRKSTTNKSASGGTTSTQTMSSSSNKPTILLEFSGHDTASIGYADHNTNNILSATAGGPLHTVPLPSLDGFRLTSARDAERVFGLYAAPLAELWSRLHDHKHHHSSTGSGGRYQRKVVVLHSQGLYPNRYWKLALGRLLHNVLLGYSPPRPQQQQQQQPHIEVAFVSALEMVPMVIAATTPTSDSVTCLTVYLSATEVQCMIYAMGHGLEYTYQSCGYASSYSSEHTNQPARVQELQQLQQQSLQQPTLVTALSLCLQSCPVALRRAAVHNIVVAGSVVVPQFARLLAGRLHQFWNSDGADDDETKKESKSDDPRDDAGLETHAVVWTGTAIHKQTLQSLSPHIGILDYTTVPSALLPWMGARFWSLRQQPAMSTYRAKSPPSPTSTVVSVWKPLATDIEMY